jgi:hypothetical protein
MKFKAIAIKCNEEQFKAIELKLLAGGCRVIDIHFINDINYLVNNYCDYNHTITNVNPSVRNKKNREVHEQWDEKVFLEACGIETFTITKDTILKYEMKEEFPELFPLESGRWLKNSDYPLWMVYIVGDGGRFGFNANGVWFNEGSSASGVEICENILNSKNSSYATVEEVKTKLINEAEKRGFVKGVKFVSIADTPSEVTYESPWFDGYKTKMMWNYAGGLIFINGVWAEVVKKIAPEDNNGWTKIYDESDLPTEDGIYEVLLMSGTTPYRANLEAVKKFKTATHWRKSALLPIE